MKPIRAEISVRDLETGQIIRINNAYVTLDTAVRLVGEEVGATYRPDGPNDPVVDKKVVDRAHITIDGTAPYPYAVIDPVLDPRLAEDPVQAEVGRLQHAYSMERDKVIAAEREIAELKSMVDSLRQIRTPYHAVENLAKVMPEDLGNYVKMLSEAWTGLLPKLQDFFAFRTSRRIKYATDAWGNTDTTHFNLEWDGKILQMTVDDSQILLVGPCFKVSDVCANAVTLKVEKY